MRLMTALCLLLCVAGCGTKFETKKDTVVGYTMKVVGQGTVSNGVKRHDYFILEDENENRYLVVSGDVTVTRMGAVTRDGGE